MDSQVDCTVTTSKFLRLPSSQNLGARTDEPARLDAGRPRRLDAASGRAAAPKEARAGGGASTLQPWESTGSLFAMLTSAEAAPAPQRHRAGAAGFFEDHKSEKSGKLVRCALATRLQCFCCVRNACSS